MDADSAGSSQQDEAQRCVQSPWELSPRLAPVPVQSSLKSKGFTLSFKINGRTLPVTSQGGSTELRLSSSSGFTSITIPEHTPVAPPSPASSFSPVISGGSSELRFTSSSGLTSIPIPDHTPVAPPSPVDGPSPVISAVVSGEAAEKVLNDHLVMVEAPPPAGEDRLSQEDRVRTKNNRKVGAALRLLQKGDCSPAPPPACGTCCSQYKLITELRGFLCMCSPIISRSLIVLKKKQKPVRKKKTTSNLNTSLTQSADEVQSRPLPPDLSDPSSLRPVEAEPAEGKLVILLEDFYYGSALGEKAVQSDLHRMNIGPISCSVCSQTLSNNIRLMRHMQIHACDALTGCDSVCPHCFRHFLTADKLQSHVHQVHTSSNSTVSCRICELCFGSEPALLCHMRTNHRPGEMPYSCQVCDFRSSSYSDVWSHFEKLHSNTGHLLCHFCLRVLQSNACYQQHLALHRRSFNLTCPRCRLHFLFVRDRLQHEVIHHKTHIKPSQLNGLKPGTKVTVRTYSVTTDGTKDPDQPVPPSNRRPPKRKRVERLSHLCSVGPAPPAQRCVECGRSVDNFTHHFLSVAHCWICSFSTSCSVSYASHMISNHSHTRKRNSDYQTIFTPEPRLTHPLKCESCPLSTCRGDLMANHLAAQPQHTCTVVTPPGWSVCEDADSSDGNTTALQAANNSVMSSGLGGAFVPVLLRSTPLTSSQLSIKRLTALPHSLPAMTITFRRPRPQPAQSLSQLSLVLQALCHGVPQAALRSQTSPQVVQSLMEQLELDLSECSWGWGAEPLAEWVLSRREQQLDVCEDVLLNTARTALRRAQYGPDAENADVSGKWTQGELRACYTWTVDFLLRKEVGLCRITGSKLPRVVQERSRCYAHSLRAQIRTFSLPRRSVGFMDEFSVFLDVDGFHRQDPLSLQFSGSSPLLDVVLSALSDGTFLPPLLFYTGATPTLPHGFPHNVMLLTKPQGFTDHEKLTSWIYKAWRPGLSSVRGNPSLLLMDTYRGHRDVSFRRTLTLMSTSIHFIPPSCCSIVQPLNVSVTPVLQDFLQSRWSRLVSEGGLDGLGLDQLVLAMCCWFSEVSSTLSAETDFLSSSFSAVCDLQQLKAPQQSQNMINQLRLALDSGTEPVPGTGPEAASVPGDKPDTGTKPESAPGTGPDLKPDTALEPRTKQEPGTGPVIERVPETKPELKLVFILEPATKHFPKPAPGNKPDTETKLQASLGTEPVPGTKLELKLESGSVPRTQLQPGTEPVPGTKVELNLESGSVPRTQLQPGTEPVPGTKVELNLESGSVPGTQLQPGTEPVPGTKVELNLESGSVPGTQLQPGTEPVPGTKVELKLESGSVPGTQLQPGTEPVPGTKVELKLESGSVPGTEAVPGSKPELKPQSASDPRTKPGTKPKPRTALEQEFRLLKLQEPELWNRPSRTRSGTRTAPRSGTEPEAALVPGNKPDLKPDLASEPGTVPVIEPVPETKPELFKPGTKQVPKPDTESKLQASPGTDPVPGTKPELKLEPGSVPRTKQEPGTEAVPGTKPELKLEPGSVPRTKQEPGTKPELKLEPGSVPRTKQEPGTEAVPGSKPELKLQSDSNPGSKPETKPGTGATPKPRTALEQEVRLLKLQEPELWNRPSRTRSGTRSEQGSV